MLPGKSYEASIADMVRLNLLGTNPEFQCSIAKNWETQLSSCPLNIKKLTEHIDFHICSWQLEE